jgi:hypothetical protein
MGSLLVSMLSIENLDKWDTCGESRALAKLPESNTTAVFSLMISDSDRLGPEEAPISHLDPRR